MNTILVIDDDDNLRDTVGLLLEQEGYKPLLAADGKTGYEKALSAKPDLILVDLRLPGMSGIEISKQLRAGKVNTPIIVLSAVGQEVDKVLLLEIGADDYVVKPFGSRELLARIKAVLRRTSPDARKVTQFGEVTIDFERRVVTLGVDAVKMTPAEYNLLTYFVSNP
ncbi:MAG TPA: response regulator transcription factor, partial [Bryobacteraceae bacterium]|nr:response regulator transcription factor [Bryobacteraceae bacterium]